MDVVHHSNHLIWFEMARIEMLDRIGLPYTEIEKRGLLLPVLAATADYKRPARFDDRLDVHLYMREKPRARFRFDYEVLRDGLCLATGTTTHGFMNPEGKGLRPPEDFLAKIQAVWNRSIPVASPA